MPLEFERTVEHARFYSPLEDFQEDSAEIEIREDPLTGQHTRIVPEVFPRPDGETTVDSVVGDGEGCFFCPDNVEEATPEYPDFVGVDRGSVGEAVSFPNLFPYGKHSNVVVLTEEHFRPLGELSADRLADGFDCALEYVHRVLDHEGATYASINMNLLPPSGSSVVHPHLQTIVDDHGTAAHRRIHDAERAYLDEHGNRYWEDLLDAERGGPRYVGETGDVEWIAPFAPVHQWHVAGITDRTSIPEPGDDVVADLAAGIERVLSYYAELGLTSHNFSLRLTAEEPASPAVVDIVARPPMEADYVNDAFFFTMLGEERIVDAAPESYAPELRELF